MPETSPDRSELDPISALLAAADHTSRQALLPAATQQATAFAEMLRTTLATYSTTADSGVADSGVTRLLARIHTSLAVHEQFAARWAGGHIDDASWPHLALELHRLVADWAPISTATLPENE